MKEEKPILLKLGHTKAKPPRGQRTSGQRGPRGAGSYQPEKARSHQNPKRSCKIDNKSFLISLGRLSEKKCSKKYVYMNIIAQLRHQNPEGQPLEELSRVLIL